MYKLWQERIHHSILISILPANRGLNTNSAPRGRKPGYFRFQSRDPPCTHAIPKVFVRRYAPFPIHSFLWSSPPQFYGDSPSALKLPSPRHHGAKFRGLSVSCVAPLGNGSSKRGKWTSTANEGLIIIRDHGRLADFDDLQIWRL